MSFQEQVNQKLSLGNVAAALNLAKNALAEQPNNPSAHFTMSRVLHDARQLNDALAFAHSCLKLSPENRFYASHLVRLLALNGRHTEALAASAPIEETMPTRPETWDNLNIVYTQCGELERACHAAKHAYNLAPNNSHYIFNYAAALRNIGDMELAEHLYNEAIKRNTTDYEAYKNRSDLRTQTAEKNNIDELLAKLSQCKEQRGEMLLRSALAKEHEDLKEHELSFSHLAAANRIRRKNMKYSVEHDLQSISDIKRAYSTAFFSQSKSLASCPNEEPIFILGMPRTGSTLLERMLSMHSKIYAAGELNNLSLTLATMVKKTSVPIRNKTELIHASTTLNYAEFGHHYINSTRPRTGKTLKFIDKMPTNFLNIGLINLALPNAKIIHINREPMDTCYAIFKNMFKDAYPYSYDQEELGQYYLAYLELMSHWNSVLPGFIFNLSYEDLIAKPEETLKKLFLFLELDWQSACLDFSKNNTPTNTASAAQVRQPIYKDSLQKWRRYEKHLTPLKNVLEHGGISID